jgi:hypothetical protein
LSCAEGQKLQRIDDAFRRVTWPDCARQSTIPRRYRTPASQTALDRAWSTRSRRCTKMYTLKTHARARSRRRHVKTHELIKSVVCDRA